MENIELFTRACKEYGLIDAETFQTVDLWDGENLHQVCVCIHALGRKALKNGAKGNYKKEMLNILQSYPADLKNIKRNWTQRSNC